MGTYAGQEEVNSQRATDRRQLAANNVSFHISHLSFHDRVKSLKTVWFGMRNDK